MKRRWLAIPLAMAAIAAVWIVVGGGVDTSAVTRVFGRDPQHAATRTKPICSQVVVPAGDCIPQHLADLPPDPGPEGMKTLEGIDSDKDGVRDDVQRFIAERWPQSERARRSLTEIAKGHQFEVKMGDSIPKEEAHAFAQKVGAKVAGCYSGSVSKDIIHSGAHELVGIKVTNTPERYRQAQKFNRLLHGSVLDMDKSPLVEQCGYNPAALPD